MCEIAFEKSLLRVNFNYNKAMCRNLGLYQVTKNLVFPVKKHLKGNSSELIFFFKNT